MKIRFFIFLIIVVLVSGCTLTQNENIKRDDKNYIETEIINVENNDNTSPPLIHENPKRIFINLNHLVDIENIHYRIRCHELDINFSQEFTWWNHYTADDSAHLLKYYDFILPDEIDPTKHDIIISFGRELKYLYYYEEDYLPASEWALGGYRARPIFEGEHIPNSAYIYLVDQINLCDSELASDDMDSFMNGNVPFELPTND